MARTRSPSPQYQLNAALLIQSCFLLCGNLYESACIDIYVAF
jgi:hypothetical protein